MASAPDAAPGLDEGGSDSSLSSLVAEVPPVPEPWCEPASSNDGESQEVDDEELEDGELKIWGLGFRVGVVLVTILFAVFVPHFSLLMGFIGNFTGCLLSFVWPCVFHLYLRRHVMSWTTMCWDIFIILLGFLFALVGMYYSAKALNKAFLLGIPT